MIINLKFENFHKIKNNIKENKNGRNPLGFYVEKNKSFELRFSIFNNTFKTIVLKKDLPKIMNDDNFNNFKNSLLIENFKKYYLQEYVQALKFE